MRLALLVALVVFSPVVAAAADPSPSVPTWIEADYGLDFVSLTDIAFTGTLDVHEMLLHGDALDASEMRDTYAATGATFLADVEDALRGSVESSLASAFPTAESRTVKSVKVDKASLEVAGTTDAFDPPVRVDIVAEVVRSPSSLGVSLTSDGLEAIFDAGARVPAPFTLGADPGYDSTYRITAPAGLVFARTPDGSLSSDSRTLTVVRDNADGFQAISGTVLAHLYDPAATAATAEAIATTIETHMGETGASEIPIEVDVRLEIGAVSLEERFPGVLPPGVTLTHINADAIRRLHKTGVISDTQLAAAETSILRSVDENLTRSLKSDVSSTGGFDGPSLARNAQAPFSADPPLAFTARSVGAYKLDGPAGDNLDLAFDIGAALDLELALFGAKNGPTTFVLHPPPGIEIVDAQGADSVSDGNATYRVASSAQEAKAKLTLRKIGAPSYEAPAASDPSQPAPSAQEAELDITIDIQDLDVELTKALNGDLGALDMEIRFEGRLGVIRVPESISASFDPRVHLDYLSSDAIRMLRERDVLTDEQYAKLEDELLARMADGLSTALGRDVEVTGGFDEATLAPELVADPPSGDKPIVFLAKANARYALSPQAAPDAAVSLYSRTQVFTLPKVSDLETAYTFILPRGIAVTSVDTDIGTSSTGESGDGRDQFTVRHTPSTATVTLAVTPTFVFLKFWPVVLLAVVLLLLIVGTPIALVVRHRRKKKAP